MGSTRIRRFVLSLVAATLLVGAPTASFAADGGKDNTAIAVNTKDGSREVRTSFQITDLKGDPIEPTNTAFAYASCTNCDTYALAIQVAFIHSTPQTFTPLNQAWAFNNECMECVTVADAYQFVTTVPEGAALTKDGDRQLKDLRKQVGDLKKGTLGPLELQEAVSGVVAEVRDVLATEIEHTGDIDDERLDAKVEDQMTTPGAPAPETVPASSETVPADTAPVS
jgi:putative peptide zinc metalloprotease protein